MGEERDLKSLALKRELEAFGKMKKKEKRENNNKK